ncbi:PAS domain-containing sensor histidine kinase [Candidatus Sulfurimonas baltica]|uniref:histidine kinase n=1 Tax=Candidatus Sulfurimonas baltica TaxID=2740404 RepID=A0A7S7LWY7_9BACT|nr:PAS domain S-box protein [Candidatus Sulfurimonas baltica]QOY52896.1 PAS domain S-box protein [Candidatus Sulfurimonas baltica]
MKDLTVNRNTDSSVSLNSASDSFGLANLESFGGVESLNMIEETSPELTISDNNNLRQKEALIFSSVSDGILVLDIDGNHTIVNQAAADMLGYTIEEMVGKHSHKMWHHTHPDGTSFHESECPIYKTIKKNSTSHRNECMFWRKDGSSFIVDYSSNPLVKNGEVNGVVVVFRDISELKEAQKELKIQQDIVLAQSRQAAMGEMVAMIAHQWRQPLTIVSMAVNNLKIDMDLGTEITNETIDEMSDTIFEQVNHLSNTIDDFSDFLKPDKKKESVNICDVMERAIRMTGSGLKNNNIHVDIKMNCKSNIKAYPGELLQVFLNIINNSKDAIKHSQVKEPRIAIDVNEIDGLVIASICDNGGGIAYPTLKLLGQPYVSTRNKNGTGLGIYMSKTIIEKHLGGTLSWKNIGEGACFTVALQL